MEQEFQWMIQQGRVGMRREGSSVVLDVNPESHSVCLLNAEDSLGMIDVLSKIGQEIWQSASAQQSALGNQFRVDEDSGYIWDTSAGELRLNLSQNNNTVQMTTDNHVDCVLDIQKLVEFIQILQHLSGQIAESAG